MNFRKLRNNLCEKYKWIDWIDDNIIYYLIDKPYSVYKDIRAWYWYNFNRSKFNLVREAFLSYPFDGAYIDNIIYYKICEVYNYFSKRPGYCSVEKLDDVIRWLGIAKKLGYIITHENELWDGDGDVFKNTWHSWSKVYVNLKNKNRFAYRWIDYEHNNKVGYSTQMYNNSPWELYIVKARRLLYRILEEKGLEWWD